MAPPAQTGRTSTPTEQRPHRSTINKLCAIGPVDPGLVPAVIASAVVFGLAHGQFGWTNVGSAAGHGLMFGALAVWTKSLWPSIVAHTLFDAVALLA